jgi:hypothetical protein
MLYGNPMVEMPLKYDRIEFIFGTFTRLLGVWSGEGYVRMEGWGNDPAFHPAGYHPVSTSTPARAPPGPRTTPPSFRPSLVPSRPVYYPDRSPPDPSSVSTRKRTIRSSITRPSLGRTQGTRERIRSRARPPCNQG